MPHYVLNGTSLFTDTFAEAINRYNSDEDYAEIREEEGMFEITAEDSVHLALESSGTPPYSNVGTNNVAAPPIPNTGQLYWSAPAGEQTIVSTPKSSKEKKIGIPEKTTISNLYRYKGLSKYQGLGGKTPVRADTTFVGVEVELENVEVRNLPSSTWKMTEDGSLKIQGMEFVTIPIQFKYLEVELERLFAGLASGSPSARCSIHIHINARDFTITELKNFILLYLIFEHSFYNFSGGRKNNNFCTPLTYYPDIVKQFLKRLNEGFFLPTWYKYHGFNLAPLFGGDTSDSIGTIEFRHMEGTTDVAYILNWINLIVSLKISAKKMKTSEIMEHIQNMNTTSGYYWLAENVFKEYAPLLTKQPTFKDDVEHCITMAKLITFKEQHPNQEEEISIIKRR